MNDGTEVVDALMFVLKVIKPEKQSHYAIAAIQNYWMARFERGCGETMDTAGRSNQTVRSAKRRER